MLVKVDVRNVDAVLWAGFKRCVLDKNGKLHGCMGKEMNNALRLYLTFENQYNIKHKHATSERTDSKVAKLKLAVTENWNQMTERDIEEEIITTLKVTDPRSIRKYREELIAAQIIERIAPYVFKVNGHTSIQTGIST